MTARQHPSPEPVNAAAPVLEARALTKHFPLSGTAVRGPGNRRVLHAVENVSLELWPATTVALVGESGSGKSTLARLLMGLYRPTSGEILLDGTAVRSRHRTWRRTYTQAVQLILQDPFASLNPAHSVRYQLLRPLRNHPRQPRGNEDTTLRELMDTVQLTPAGRYLDKRPHELSGGQRQRVAIARALAAQPRVLLADEPVSMLDVSIRLGVLNLLDGLRRDRNLAILYVTHDIASARYFARETAVMYAAEVVEQGPSEQVTQHPAHPYTKLLISSAPKPSRRGATSGAGNGTGSPAEPPDLINPPIGCRFAARCPHVMDNCRHEPPRWTDLGGGHRVRCHLHTGPDGES